MVKEEYNYAKGSPVINKRKSEEFPLIKVYHFSFSPSRNGYVLMMIQHFKDDENHLFRDSTPIAVSHDYYQWNTDFEKQLTNFIQKTKRHIKNDDQLSLTREEIKQIRKFFRDEQRRSKTLGRRTDK